ncbi:putative transmembrane protein [Apostichopus japonicus]|uniref:Putative transmembrane protein n=1 Tax=Stichopus japonicus TaxID=307972 RepID=A0A2G8JYK7_STIJA|nr:putative transmembrane protein [Apostichopus japonicus]
MDEGILEWLNNGMDKDGAIRVGEIDGVFSLLSHVDWSERWLQALLVFHILCFVATILTRFYTNIQAFLFIALLAIVFFAETINQYAALNFKHFSRLQYFDSGGLFISLVLCLPILLNCFVMLIFWLYRAGTMLVKVKKAKLKQRSGKKTKGPNEETESEENVTEEDKKEK